MRRLLLSVLGMLMICSQLLAQNRTVTGKVIDAAGAPVSGASVQIKNTTLGTITKEDGTFSISVPPNGRVLVISAIGQAAQEVTIGTQSNISISLRPADENLQAVVVTGYTREKSHNLRVLPLL